MTLGLSAPFHACVRNASYRSIARIIARSLAQLGWSSCCKCVHSVFFGDQPSRGPLPVGRVGQSPSMVSMPHSLLLRDLSILPTPVRWRSEYVHTTYRVEVCPTRYEVATPILPRPQSYLTEGHPTTPSPRQGLSAMHFVRGPIAFCHTTEICCISYEVPCLASCPCPTQSVALLELVATTCMPAEPSLRRCFHPLPIVDSACLGAMRATPTIGL